MKCFKGYKFDSLNYSFKKISLKINALNIKINRILDENIIYFADCVRDKGT